MQQLSQAVTLQCACSGSGSGQGSSKAGFPWWAGLIIALVVLAVIAVLAGLACLGRARRRRRMGSALQEAIHKQVPALLSPHLTAGCERSRLHPDLGGLYEHRRQASKALCC